MPWVSLLECVSNYSECFIPLMTAGARIAILAVYVFRGCRRVACPNQAGLTFVRNSCMSCFKIYYLLAIGRLPGTGGDLTHGVRDIWEKFGSLLEKYPEWWFEIFSKITVEAAGGGGGVGGQGLTSW